MKKFLRLCSLFVFAIAISSNSWAQDRSVTGIVTSIDDGSTLPGVNVVIKGTTTGTITDFDGKYTLNVSDGAVLVYSFIGYVSEEIEVGSRSVIDVQLSSDVKQLSEVVVTALGIERQKRELGYGVSSISSEDLLVARAGNVVSALAGKVSGVQITNQGGGISDDVNITIRGVSSLSNGNNRPLFVVDGVPITVVNDVTSQDTNPLIAGRANTGTGLPFNADDVASMTVLKGASATALYGSRAAAGVILVTLKKGKKGDGPSVSINSSVRTDKVFRLPDYQNEFAGGSFTKYDSSATFSNWGGQIDGQTVTKAISGERGPLEAYPDNAKDFYEDGLTLINNVAVSSANEDGDYRLSVTSLNRKGIIPASELDRLTFSFNAGAKHTEKFKSRFSVNYVRTTTAGNAVTGANNPNIVGYTSFVRTLDFNAYKPWIDAAGNQLGTIGQQDNNPFWIANENKFSTEVDRIFGNFQFDYTPAKWLNFSTRIGYDTFTDERFRSNRIGTRGAATGDFTNDIIQRNQLNLDIIGTANRQLNEDINLNVLAGFNFNRRVRERDVINSSSLAVPELFSPANAQVSTPTRAFTEQKLFGVYGEISLGYKDYLFLTATGRNDWNSTLPLDGNSFFYPSVSVGFVFTDAFDLSNDILSYGKLRASYAQVGNGTAPYRLDFTYNPQPNVFGQFGAAVNFPFNGNLGFTQTTVAPPATLVPEKQKSIEFGIELALLNGRVSVDVNYYDTENANQILRIPVPQSTGVALQTLNVGQTSSTGIEVEIGGDVIRAGDFTWNSRINYSNNDFQTDELVDGLDRITISSGFSSVTVVAEPGLSHQLRGIGFLTDSVSGRPIIDPNTGLRLPGAVDNFGDIYANFNMGFVNSFTYKGITLSTTIDYKDGGLLSSASVAGLWNAGAVSETTLGRTGTYIDTRGVIDNGDGTFRDNDVPVRDSRAFWTGIRSSSMAEAQIFDATYIKLREVGISYALPKKMIDKTPFRSVSVGVEGRNLALLYSKVPHIDPEVGLLGSGNASAGSIEVGGTPTTTSFGFNVGLTF